MLLAALLLLVLGCVLFVVLATHLVGIIVLVVAGCLLLAALVMGGVPGGWR